MAIPLSYLFGADSSILIKTYVLIVNLLLSILREKVDGLSRKKDGSLRLGGGRAIIDSLST